MPQKQKVSIETKVTIIQDYINGCIGMREAARRAGVSHNIIEHTAHIVAFQPFGFGQSLRYLIRNLNKAVMRIKWVKISQVDSLHFL